MRREEYIKYERLKEFKDQFGKTKEQLTKYLKKMEIMFEIIYAKSVI